LSNVVRLPPPTSSATCFALAAQRRRDAFDRFNAGDTIGACKLLDDANEWKRLARAALWRERAIEQQRREFAGALTFVLAKAGMCEANDVG